MAATCLVASVPAAARRQATQRSQVSEPVVQPVPTRGNALDAALVRLARDPRDIDALIDAGNAALVLGDVDAATGFFRRADQVSPGNPRVKAGLAGAMVHNDDPFDAIPLFDEAAKAGALEPALVADRGLAYDLVGDSATAQRYYREAQARAPNEEVARRLALSLAISGDGPGSETILLPLLRQRDLAAWRTRTFALAILGDTEQAVKVANTILPADLAAGVAPYLRYMPRLTHAQQAAAANFGNFPRAAEIGRDDPRVAQYAPRLADAGLVPQGEPLGRKSRSRDRNRARRQEEARSAAPAAVVAATPAQAVPDQVSATRVALAEPQPRKAIAPAPALVPAATSTPAPWMAQAAPRPLPPVSPPPAPAPPISASPPAPPLSAPPPPPPVPMAAAPVALPRPAPPPPVATSALPPPPVPRGLAEAFAEFQRPSVDVTPAAGAVDLRRIKPTRPKPEKPPEPPPPSHPSRIWVQVATGRDKGALGFDWRRMTREAAEVFHGKQPSVSAWGQTNRLLTGPFQSEAAANSFIAQLRKADIDGAFVWTSPAGQVVDALPEASVRR